jgi:tungstate transport system permease protein
MDLILEGIKKAFWLLITFDPEVMGITLLSLEVSGIATLVSLLIGISTGVTVALSRFIGKRMVVSLINTGMGLPPVVVGLFVTLFLWRNGPLGFLEILYTPTAMVIAQTIIATPIVMGITLAAIQQLPQKLRLQILSLGATRLQMVWILIKEAKLPLLAAVMAGFGGVISEVGASIMVGGNIKGYSRVLTTATVLEPGEFRCRHCLGYYPPVACLLGQSDPHSDPAEGETEIGARKQKAVGSRQKAKEGPQTPHRFKKTPIMTKKQS